MASPHPTVILTTRFIRNHEDPTIALLKAGNNYDVPRSIAHLRVVLKFVVHDELNPRMKLRRNEEAPITHAVLANHNADKNQIQRRIKPETTKTTEGRANMGYTGRGLMKITVAKPAKTY